MSLRQPSAVGLPDKFSEMMKEIITFVLSFLNSAAGRAALLYAVRRVSFHSVLVGNGMPPGPYQVTSILGVGVLAGGLSGDHDGLSSECPDIAQHRRLWGG